jgi:phage/plasmid-associated DNA primase
MEMKNQKPLMVRFRGGIMVGCNGLPSFTDDKGEHIFERLLLIMCTNVIPEEKRDATLLDKMRPEIPAITNWFLEGLQRLIENGYKFTRSAAAEEAVNEYRQRLDSVYRFISEWNGTLTIGGDPVNLNRNCIELFVITKNRADQYPKKNFYDTYVEWSNDSEIDLTPIKRKNLNQRLEALGLEVDPRGVYGNQHGIYTIRGIKKEYVPLDEVDNRLTFDNTKSPPEWQDATTETTPWD